MLPVEPSRDSTVALMIDLAGQGEALVLFVHLDIAAAGYAAGAHAAGHNGRMAGLAAADGQDALCCTSCPRCLRGWSPGEPGRPFHRARAMHNGVLSGEYDGAGVQRQEKRRCPCPSELQPSSGPQRRTGGMQQQYPGTLASIMHQRFFLGNHALVDRDRRRS